MSPQAEHPHRRSPCHQENRSAGQPALWFIFTGDRLLLQGPQEEASVPLQPHPPVEPELIGYCRDIDNHCGHPCLVIELPETARQEHLSPVSLREAHAYIGEELWIIAGRASQILRWRQDHRYCGRCATEMVEEPQELLRRCPSCNFVTYPRISPAVIMSVLDGDRILLGRAAHFPPHVYSVLAGYVEPGETLEQAVAREVREEAGIEITDIRYFSSQPWPFPHSLMVGFVARYRQGTLQVDNNELEEVRWFSVDELPRLPPSFSIARRLIDHFIEEQGG